LNITKGDVIYTLVVGMKMDMIAVAGHGMVAVEEEHALQINIALAHGVVVVQSIVVIHVVIHVSYNVQNTIATKY
jgi:hypothetical protein